MNNHSSYQTALNRFNNIQEKLQAITYASNILFWDATTGAPKSGADARSKSIGAISGFSYELLVNPQMKSDLDVLLSKQDQLDDKTKVMLRKMKKEYDRTASIPIDEFQKYHALIAKASMIWEQAKEKSDFSLFEPYLSEIVDYLRKFAQYRGYQDHPYNVYLDEYEEGMTVKQLEQFFSVLKKRIVPLIKKIAEQDPSIKDEFLRLPYSVNKQMDMSKKLLNRLGYDLNRGWFKESVHPFTMGVDIDDVRLTTHYHKNDLLSAILSTAHEGGHAIYEQNISKDLQGTLLATGTSLGVHESQSRIYENNFVKSKAFLQYYFPKLQTAYKKQLGNVSFDEFYQAVNQVKPSLIRIEADELTYSLHIMIRYEIEMALMEKTVQTKDLPTLWNQKMQDYLGIQPDSDATGVLQDVHWSDGLFGYFPTYALGSAYAAQFYHHMNKDLDVDAYLSKGNFGPLTNWLNEKIHLHGSMKTPNELIEEVTKEPFDPEYYCDYLEKKYQQIYDLK